MDEKDNSQIATDTTPISELIANAIAEAKKELETKYSALIAEKDEAIKGLINKAVYEPAPAQQEQVQMTDDEKYELKAAEIVKRLREKAI